MFYGWFSQDEIQLKTTPVCQDPQLLIWSLNFSNSIQQNVFYWGKNTASDSCVKLQWQRFYMCWKKGVIVYCTLLFRAEYSPHPQSQTHLPSTHPQMKAESVIGAWNLSTHATVVPEDRKMQEPLVRTDLFFSGSSPILCSCFSLLLLCFRTVVWAVCRESAFLYLQKNTFDLMRTQY